MDEQPSRRRSWPWILLVLIAAGGGAAFYYRAQVLPWAETHAGPVLALLHIKTGDQPKATQSAEQAQQKPGSASVPVTGVAAKTGNFPVILTGLGTVEAYNSVLVRSRVDGQITKLQFQGRRSRPEGRCAGGDRSAPLQGGARAGAGQEAAGRGQPRQRQARSRRYQSLAKSDFATRQQLDTQTSQVAQLTAQIAADQAAIDNAQTQLDYTTIKAPITGRVGLPARRPGQHRQRIEHDRHRRDHPDQADRRDLHRSRKTRCPRSRPAWSSGPLPVKALSTDGSQVLGRRASSRCSTTRSTRRAARSGSRRPSTNNDNKLWPGLSVTTRMTVSTRRKRRARPGRRGAARPEGVLCLRGGRRQQGRAAAAQDHADGPEAGRDRGGHQGRARWSSRPASTGCSPAPLVSVTDTARKDRRGEH